MRSAQPTEVSTARTQKQPIPAQANSAKVTRFATPTERSLSLHPQLPGPKTPPTLFAPRDLCDLFVSPPPTPTTNPRNGAEGTRTPDIQLAKLALYQLSYRPEQSFKGRRRHPSTGPSDPLKRPSSSETTQRRPGFTTTPHRPHPASPAAPHLTESPRSQTASHPWASAPPPPRPPAPSSAPHPSGSSASPQPHPPCPAR